MTDLAAYVDPTGILDVSIIPRIAAWTPRSSHRRWNGFVGRTAASFFASTTAIFSPVMTHALAMKYYDFLLDDGKWYMSMSAAKTVAGAPSSVNDGCVIVTHYSSV